MGNSTKEGFELPSVSGGLVRGRGHASAFAKKEGLKRANDKVAARRMDEGEKE